MASLRRDDPAAERDRVLQYEAVDAIRQTGVLGLRVPTEYGGPGGKVRDVLSAVIQIGRGSSNVAQALRSHFGFSERLLSNRATRQEAEEWFPRVYAGIIVGNAITDAAGRAPSSADTKVLPDTAGVLRLNGYKFYSTGTLFADVIAVSALDADGHDVQAIIPADRAGVELFDDWDGFGQRTTASGGTRFTDVEVLPDEVVTASDGNDSGIRPLSCSCIWPRLRWASRTPCATMPSNTCARRRVRPRIRSPTARRPIRSCCRPSERSRPPHRRRSRSCWPQPMPSTVSSTKAGRHDPDAVADVAVTVARAQLVAERLTISAAERLFDTGGASATARALNLDRHWRNARTIAGHSPLAYKAYAAGNYAVNGTWPPANGYF